MYAFILSICFFKKNLAIAQNELAGCGRVEGRSGETENPVRREDAGQRQSRKRTCTSRENKQWLQLNAGWVGATHTTAGAQGPERKLWRETEGGAAAGRVGRFGTGALRQRLQQ